MLPDYHMHTVLCRHAKGDVLDYINSARAKALPEMAFTDHAPAPNGYDPVNRMALAQFPTYQQMVTSLCDGSTTPRVLYGVEADYYEGCETFLCDWLPAQEFDIVLGSVHYIRNWGFDDPAQHKEWERVDVKTAWQEYFRLVSRLALSRMYDVLAHPDLPKKFGHRPSDRDVKDMVCPALDRISAAGMTIEINTSGLRRVVKEIYPSPLILTLAREREIPITFGSDAHEPQDVGFAFDQALDLARDCGYTQSVIFRKRRKMFVNLPELTSR